MGGDILIEKRVSDLQWDDVIVDRHGRRRIVEITRDYDRCYIDFNDGPSNWYLDAELVPVEVMS